MNKKNVIIGSAILAATFGILISGSLYWTKYNENKNKVMAEELKERELAEAEAIAMVQSAVQKEETASHNPAIAIKPGKSYAVKKAELKEKIASVKNIYLNKLLKALFIEDLELAKRFKFSSAAKNIHHSFMGGLIEHSLNVAKLCEFYCKSYPIINRDLLITAALCHDIGKTVELSSFPENDYTDEGQLLGHIVIGYDIISKKADSIEGFPLKLLNELKHCILAHHGELEYGSPKKPALIEALALSLADNTDAKLETMKGLLEAADENAEWLGYNRMFESNIRRTVL